MGIQINGNTDTVASTTSGGRVNLTPSINVTGVSTFTTINATSITGVSTAGITTAYIGSVNDGPIAGLKNMVINGGFDIWQRGTSFTTHNTYTADRWWMVTDSVGTVTISRQDISTQGLGSQYCLRAERSVGTNRWVVGTQLETSVVKSVLGKKITLSFYLRKGSALTSNVDVTLATSSTEERFGSSVDSVTITASNASINTSTFTKFSGTLTVPTSSSALGIKIEFSANQAGASNAYFEVAQVQLEEGPVATPFERRSYGQELALCQRYCHKWSANGDGTNLYSRFPMGIWGSTTQITVPFSHPVSMRTVTKTVSSNTSAVGVYSQGLTFNSGVTFGVNTDANTLDTTFVNVGGLSGGTGNALAAARFLGDGNAYILFTTEL